MKRNKSFVSKYFPVFLIFLMLTSLLTPMNVSANNTSSKVAKKDNVTNNIHNTLAKEFEEEEYVRYLVMLHEQTDTMEIALNAEKNANKNSLSFRL